MSLDGSEDHEIHCLKDGSVAADVRPAISETTSRLASENDNTEDPIAFADEDGLRRMRSFLRMTVDFVSDAWISIHGHVRDVLMLRIMMM